MPKIECFCTICSKKFHVWPSKIKQGGGRVCSMDCLFIYRGKYLHKANFKKGSHPSPDTEFKKGMIKELSASWKGGRNNSGHGYIKNPCENQKRKYEHRLIMEKHIGRPLTSKEVVHHINGIRNDNHIENLQLFENNSDHIKHHIKIKNKSN